MPTALRLNKEGSSKEVVMLLMATVVPMGAYNNFKMSPRSWKAKQVCNLSERDLAWIFLAASGRGGGGICHNLQYYVHSNGNLKVY